MSGHNGGIAVHLRSGRFAQRERPAAGIPARIRARRLSTRFAVAEPLPDDSASGAIQLSRWIVGRLGCG